MWEWLVLPRLHPFGASAAWRWAVDCGLLTFLVMYQARKWRTPNNFDEHTDAVNYSAFSHKGRQKYVHVYSITDFVVCFCHLLVHGSLFSLLSPLDVTAKIWATATVDEVRTITCGQSAAPSVRTSSGNMVLPAAVTIRLSFGTPSALLNR